MEGKTANPDSGQERAGLVVAGLLHQELFYFYANNLDLLLSGWPTPLRAPFTAALDQTNATVEALGVTRITLGLLRRGVALLATHDEASRRITSSSEWDEWMARSQHACETINRAMAGVRRDLPPDDSARYTVALHVSSLALAARLVRMAAMIFRTSPEPNLRMRQIHEDRLREFPSRWRVVEEIVERTPLTDRLSARLLECARSCVAHLEGASEVTDVTARELQNRTDTVFNEIGYTTHFDAVVRSLRFISAQQFDELPKPEAVHSFERAVRLEAVYDGFGDPAKLDSAIAAMQAALQDHHTGLARHEFLSRLGGMLWKRYELRGLMPDLDASVRCVQEALGFIPEADDHVPNLRNNLGLALETRFRRVQNPHDLDEAITQLTDAVAAGRARGSCPLLWLNNYANSLRQRALLRTDAGELDRVIALFEEILQRTPDGDADQALHRQNLGNTLHNRYQITGELRDLQRASSFLRDAVDATASGTSDKAIFLGNLAAVITNLWRQQPDEELASRGDETYRRAVEEGLHTTLGIALASAANWGNWAFERGAFDVACEAFDKAASASSSLLHVQHARGAKEAWLRDTQGLGARYAYALAEEGRLDDAVVALEAGLGRMLSEALGTHETRLAQLSELGHQDLLEKYRSACAALAGLVEPEEPGRNLPPVTYAARASLIANAQAEVDRIVRSIREIPDFGDFCADLPLLGIRDAAQHAPLVYLAATRHGGFALIVPSSPSAKLSFLPLSGLTEELAAQFLFQLHTTRRLVGHDEAITALDAITRRLWTFAMGPLVEQLGANRDVVLLPVGTVAMLPLHAAWQPHEGAPSGRCYALDVLSLSYATNARSLRRLRRHESTAPGSMLVVQQPLPTRLPLLPDASAEAAAAAQSFPDSVVLTGFDATRDAVLSALSRCDVAHFCCHAVAEIGSPMESRLFMAEDASIRVGDFLERHMERPALAVLSACETAVPGAILPDEAIGFPTGLLQAGVRAVVASLWPVGDRATALLMIRFYYLWRAEGQAPLEALRSAQQWLRDTTNGQKLAFVEGLSESNLGSLDLLAALRSRPREARQEQHPDCWAAFTWTGDRDLYSASRGAQSQESKDDRGALTPAGATNEPQLPGH